MIINYCFKIRSFVLATAVSTGLSFVGPVSAQLYIVDLNSKEVTQLEGLIGEFHSPTAINDAGRVVGRFETTGENVRTHAFITGPDGVGMTDLVSRIINSLNN